ncbi:hypothetical protein [Oceanobacillus sp. CAU 1775]
MRKTSKIGIVLAILGVAVFVFGIYLLMNDDGSFITALAIPFMFLGLLIGWVSILFISKFSKNGFHLNNFIVLFMLFAFNGMALFGAAFSNTIESEYIFTVGLAFVIWGIFYSLQFIRSTKVSRTSWFIIMVVFLFFWQTGLGFKIGEMIF